jgi:hypothetical protein
MTQELNEIVRIKGNTNRFEPRLTLKRQRKRINPRSNKTIFKYVSEYVSNFGKILVQQDRHIMDFLKLFAVHTRGLNLQRFQ